MLCAFMERMRFGRRYRHCIKINRKPKRKESTVEEDKRNGNGKRETGKSEE